MAAAEREKAELLVDSWLMNDFFQPTRVQVLGWLQQGKYEEIQTRLSGKHKLTFGTAGLRARMDPGYDRMNCLTVMQTTQGLAAYLESQGMIESGASVVIGFDGRHNSESFAHVTAAVMVSRGLKVSLMERPCPTPFNPFWIVQSKAVCGIQITASHNPKADNGYKLYWSNGAQIVPPIDSAVAESIEKNREITQKVFEVLDPESCRLRFREQMVADSVSFVADKVKEQYMQMISSDVRRNEIEMNRKSPIKFAYTAMHGVGFVPFKALFESFGFDAKSSLFPVESQIGIDPEFSTVKFPNPEEKGALNLAIAEAEKNSCELVLANDPDADRFTCAERQKDGSWYQFTGDELGLLFADWQMSKSADGGILICSVVSSRMMSELCKVRGAEKFRFSDCLTGFKWIANESLRLRQGNDVKHLLGYEEAIGYQVSGLVPDKDGLSAACAMAEFATLLRAKNNQGLKERFEEIQREEIGFFTTNNGYYIIDDPEVTKAIFNDFRKSSMKQLGQFAIKSIRDVTNGIDTALPGGVKSHLPSTPDAEMITMFFENGAVVTVRASGTEPKVKYYSEMSSRDSKEQAKASLGEVVDAVKNFFYQPAKYPIKEQPSM
jgi:phosphoglucomutase